MARPRRKDVKRDSSGKSRGELFDPSLTFHQPHRREATLALVKADLDPLAAVNMQAAGTPLGRLRIAGHITAGQCAAGHAWACLVRSYSGQMGIRLPTTKTGSMSEFIGTGFYEWAQDERPPEDPDHAAKRAARTKEQYDQCYRAISDLGIQHGRRIMMTMRDICIQEAEYNFPESMVGDLRLGLNAVQRILSR